MRQVRPSKSGSRSKTSVKGSTASNVQKTVINPRHQPPYLPPEIWTIILEKTDVSTCLSLGNFVAARAFLQTPDNRTQSLTQVIKTGNLQNFKLLLGDSALYSQAVEAGHLEMAHFLGERSKSNGYFSSHLCRAAMRGHLNIVKYLVEEKNECIWDAVEDAAAFGEIEVVKYLCGEEIWGKDITTVILQKVLRSASWNGHIEVIRWLVSVLPESLTVSAVHRAALGGYLEVLRFYFQHYKEAFSEHPGIILSGGIKGCHLSVLEYIYSLGFSTNLSFKDHDLAGPAEAGRLDIFRWVEEHCEVALSETTMIAAASCGRLQIVQYLIAKEIAISPKVMDIAAARGELELVKWLHSKNKGCTAAAMDSAARNGYLEVVQWLHEHREEGCTGRAMHRAAIQGYWEIVKFLHSNRTEGIYGTTIAKCLKAHEIEIAVAVQKSA